MLLRCHAARHPSPLPAGNYHVGARGYLNSIGDYALTPTCGLPFPGVGTANYGRNPMAVAGGGMVSLANITVCSAHSVRLDSNGGLAGTLSNFMAAAGNRLGIHEWSGDAVRLGPGGRMGVRQTVGYLRRGAHCALSWHRFAQSSPDMTLDVLPPCHCEVGQRVSHGKQGDFAAPGPFRGAWRDLRRL
jgi:hypothetical protein